MTNLLQETLRDLEGFGFTSEDVYWVGSPEFGYTTWDNFAQVAAETEYDNSYGGAEIAPDLVIVGADWWLSRGEYDGSEWWEFNRYPERPSTQRHIKILDGSPLYSHDLLSLHKETK